MNFLIVGLGSMGKRRIRCLKALGYSGIYGFDLREDRQAEAASLYGIATFGDIHQALEKVAPHAMIISVPPDVHHIYMNLAVERHIHFFVEASVVDTEMEAMVRRLQTMAIVGVPSATLRFHPAIQKIEALVRSGVLGKISNVIYHCGQYLPDWHTYEPVSAYYVSNPVTGGAREIVPFELTWLTGIFGLPRTVCGHVRKTIDIAGAEKIDDTYNMLLDYGQFLMTITVDVVCRFATRRLLINGDAKQLIWDWNSKAITVYDPTIAQWETISYEMMQAATGYNPNIGENMYTDELKLFIDATCGQGKFINDLASDHKVLKLLYSIEEADRRSTYIQVAQ